MSEAVYFDTMREALWTAVIVALPILSVALAAWLAVGLFQALTSIQEMTLTFVPKLLALAVVFWMSMNFMAQTLVSFFTGRIIPLVG